MTRKKKRRGGEKVTNFRPVEFDSPEELEASASLAMVARERLAPYLDVLVDDMKPRGCADAAIAVKMEVKGVGYIWIVVSTDRVIAAQGLGDWSARVLREATALGGEERAG